jgi:molecular chaperone GrpE
MQNERPGDDELLAALEEAAAAAEFPEREAAEEAPSPPPSSPEATGEVVYPSYPPGGGYGAGWGPRTGGNGAPASTSGGAAATALATELEEVRARLLRSTADFDNYRKRMQREREETIQYANEAMLRDLLPVLDNLERAVHAGQSSRESDTLYEGVRMVVQQFHALLDQYGVRRVPGVGQPFDPAWHEAMQQMPSEIHPPGAVMEELQPGYVYRERLLRPALVIVAAPPARKPAPPPAPEPPPVGATPQVPPTPPDAADAEGESEEFEEDTLPQADLSRLGEG